MAKITKADLNGQIEKLKVEHEEMVEGLKFQNTTLQMELGAIRDRMRMIGELFKQMVEPHA